MNHNKIVGIDYGSKLAGTTVLMYLEHNKIQFWQSEKKKDADKFLMEKIEILTPNHIFIDAPLSLPNVYFDNVEYSDYFYRVADKALKGMSPMFLGGLTARAMRLKALLEQKGYQITEVYPAALARLLNLKLLNYKKEKTNIKGVQKELAELATSMNIAQLSLENWHQVDALLALISGWRFHQNIHETYGLEKEGLIIV